MENLLVAIPISSEKEEVISWAIDYWRRTRIPHHFGVDSKFSNSVVPILKKNNVENYSIFENSGQTIEAGYEKFCKCMPGNFLFRVDVDEALITKLTYVFSKMILRVNPSLQIGIPREQALNTGNGLRVCSNPLFDSIKHTQWRIFDRRLVSWDSRVHTAGFYVDRKKSIRLLRTFGFIHLNWLMLSQKDLDAKSTRYDNAGQIAENRIQNSFQLKNAEVRFSLRLALSAMLRDTLDKHFGMGFLFRRKLRKQGRQID